ncbi:cysteine peptidase family C39 domain-containing protein [Bartonella sp. LJL80]
MWLKMLTGLIFVLVVLALCWTFYNARGRLPALSWGGEHLNIQLTDKYDYQQRDPRWKDEHLGDIASAGSLGEVGCAISSIAVALSNLGIEIDPSMLNKKLVAENGFTPRGWLIWSAVEKATDGKAVAEAFSQPSRKQVDACLSEGRYPIVKYLIGGVVQHWVTVVGKKDNTYLIRDPLIQAAQPEALHHHTPFILSVRCIGLSSPTDVTSPTP